MGQAGDARRRHVTSEISGNEGKGMDTDKGSASSPVHRLVIWLREMASGPMTQNPEHIDTCNMLTKCADEIERLSAEAECCRSTITTREGLLWRHGQYISVPEADDVAREHGFHYAEQMVKSLASGEPVGSR